MTQTILDRVLEHDMLSVNIGSRLRTILGVCDEIGVFSETNLSLYLMDGASNLSWTVCNGFLRVRLERYDWTFGSEEECVEVPFEWLDMPDKELEDVLEQRVREEESREYQRVIDQLYRDAELYGYTLTEIRH